MVIKEYFCLRNNKKMRIKNLKNRWRANSDALNNILNTAENGGYIGKRHSPFEALTNDKNDLRGIDLSQKLIKNLSVENSDLSFSNFRSSRIENSVFKQIVFEKTDFSEISDVGNLFDNCLFLSCKFKNAGIGFDGSIYSNCLFKSSSFVNTVFIRSRFSSTKFINCKIDNIDFNASSFENCNFTGKLENVWFRGGFALASDKKEFGEPLENLMKNVSFENSVLVGVNFSNGCDLSTITLPKKGNYQLFKNWLEKLKYLENSIVKWDKSEKIEAEIFVRSYMVHAKNQNHFLINVEEIRDEFGIELASKIIEALLSEGET